MIIKANLACIPCMRMLQTELMYCSLLNATANLFYITSTDSRSSGEINTMIVRA